MKRIIRIVEFAWIFVAAASIYEIVRLWGTGAGKFYYITLPIAIFMFFFRRWQRLKMEKREQQNSQ